MDESVFKRAFAETGQKAVITDKEYRGGWFDVVGGINGIPTAQQFNYIMNYQEEKINYLYRIIQSLVDVFAMAPIITESEMKDYLDSTEYKTKIDNFRIGQVVIADKHVYTYIGNNPHNINCYVECGGHGQAEGFNVAIPFYLVFSLLNGNANDYGMVTMSEYDNAFNIAAAFYATFGLVDGNVKDYSSGTVAYVQNEADVGPAFNYVFGRGITGQFSPMSSEAVKAAIETRWDGTASVNRYALTPEEIRAAMDAKWNGETSGNPFAITASEISNIIKQ